MAELHVWEKIENGVKSRYRGTLEWGRQRGMRLISEAERAAEAAKAELGRLTKAADAGDKDARAKLAEAKTTAAAAEKAVDQK